VQRAANAFARRALGSASWIVILPRQPPSAATGQLSGITTSPRAVIASDRTEMTTAASAEPSAAGALLFGAAAPPFAAPVLLLAAAETNTLRVMRALGPPLRLMVCHVKTWAVEVPAESVSVSVTTYSPGTAYVWVAVGVVVTALLPSPKFHA